MCLSTAYTLEDGKKNFIIDKVASIRVENGDVIFEDLLGRTATVAGIISYVDLLNNEIICERTA
jgi:predicted RNA-binding protein